MNNFKILVLSSLLIIMISCQNDESPKPRGYFRIDFPEKEYQLLDTCFPYSFMYPKYSKISPDLSRLAEPFWINIDYLPFNAQLHISYKPIDNNLNIYLEDAHTLVNKHIPKATSINQREFINESEKVYGLVYDIRGAEAASVYQFYLTDSTSHFVRAALYFNQYPNNDSLSPVIDFLKADIEKMINTFKWKKTGKINPDK